LNPAAHEHALSTSGGLGLLCRDGCLRGFAGIYRAEWDYIFFSGINGEDRRITESNQWRLRKVHLNARVQNSGRRVRHDFSYRPVLGESVRTFLASPNDPISLPSIEAGSYSELSMGSYYGFDLDVPFYLGVYTGYMNNAPAGFYSNPVFGWAEFVNHQGVIQLLDSALVMEGGGIYVGTQTIIPVPEPGELSLFVVGVFMLGCWAERANQITAHNAGWPLQFR
jgi:hypothetical protein